MSGSTFNITDKLPDLNSNNTRIVRFVSDLPAESGGFRDFGLNEALSINNTITDSFVWRWPDGSQIIIRTFFPAQNNIFYSGTDTFIQCAGQANLVRFIDCNFFALADGAKGFDLTADITLLGGGFGINDTQFIGFSKGIRFKNYPNGITRGLVLVPSPFFVPTEDEGFVIENCGVYELTEMLMQAAGQGNQSLVTCVGAATLQARIHDDDWLTPGSQSGLHFGQNLTGFAAMSALSVNQSNPIGSTAGTFFKTLITESITAAIDASKTGTVATVSNVGGFAGFNYSGDTVNVDDVITLTNFTSYNGTFIVHKATGSQFQVANIFPMTAVPFSFDEAGDWDVDLVKLVTTDTTNLRVGQGVVVTNATGSDYSGTFTVKAIEATNFSVPFVFATVATTGDFTVGSLTERDPQIIVDLAGRQKPSKTIALGAVNSRAVAAPEETAITSDTYEVVNVSGFLENIVIERFILQTADVAEGKFTYTGQNPFQGFVSGAISAVKSGAEESYRFAMSLNGGVPRFTAITTQSIDAVSSSPAGIAIFEHSNGLANTPPVGSVVTITGFINNPLYNVRGLVIESIATEFQVQNVFFGTSEGTGSYTVAAANFVLMAVKSTEVTIPIIFMADLRPNDKISIMVAGQATGTNINITDFTFGVF